ncbi:XylR N-terminal domain-containing protein, partial [Neobacillus sp. NPDC097160]|uniref:XylR N-terminal domain-containing protein n=1 Tax=Neobacillus sp. NPDC097160 TaxID=3364298 RepID=UPI00380FD64A
MKVDSFLKDFLESGHTDFIGVNALGILRKDLVAVLGMERAKGFLLRYSHNCGVNDAKYFEENFSWESDIEIIEAGYKINDLKGHAKLIPIQVRTDRKKGDFYFEGRWYYSYEAEQHIRHFGFHPEPVCHTLGGYASGYSSQYLGEEVIFKEIECIGKGDPNCIFIGKPLKVWGDEISDILPFYKEENLSDELDRTYKHIGKQKKMLSDVLDINEKLSKILIKGGDIFTVLKLLSQNLSSTVILEDRNFNLIEACGDYIPYHFMELVEAHKTKKKSAWMDRLFNEKSTVQLTVSNQFNGLKHERIISPVLLNNEVWGYISLMKKEGTFDEMESVLLERANTICALHFSNERTAIETEKRISGGFLNELLISNPDIKNLSYRMKLMGYDLNK